MLVSQRQPKYALRKLSVGVASVLLGTIVSGYQLTAHADTSGSVTTSVATQAMTVDNQPSSDVNDSSTTQTQSLQVNQFNPVVSPVAAPQLFDDNKTQNQSSVNVHYVSSYDGHEVSHQTLTGQSYQDSGYQVSAPAGYQVSNVNQQQTDGDSYHADIPQKGFMNDFQGGFYRDGVWHWYYLFNGDARYNQNGDQVGGNGSEWYHITSPDLIHFQDQGVAIHKYQTEWGDVATGSTYVDHNNDFGKGKDTVIAFATGYGGNHGQNTMGYYSTDNGYSFKLLQNTPIMQHVGGPETNFRDPFLTKIGNKFVIYMAEGDKIGMYTSDHPLTGYQYVGGYYPPHPVLECPSLLQMNVAGQTKWVLFYGGNGGDQLSTGTYASVGHLDDKLFFVPEQEDIRVDNGPDFYGSRAMAEPDGSHDDVIINSWESNWGYATKVPNNGKIGNLAITRKLKLIKQDGKYRFVTDFVGIPNKTVTSSANNVPTGTILRDLGNGDAFQFKLHMNSMKGYHRNVTMFMNGNGYDIDLLIDYADNTVKVHRYNVLFVGNNEFGKDRTFHVDLTGNLDRDFVFNVDRHSIEILMPDGQSYTMSKYPEGHSQEIIKVLSDDLATYNYEYRQLDTPDSIKLGNGQDFKLPTGGLLARTDSRIGYGNGQQVGNYYVMVDPQTASQTFLFVDPSGKAIGQPIVINGLIDQVKSVNLVIPTGYQLANGQQLPTSVKLQLNAQPVKLVVQKRFTSVADHREVHETIHYKYADGSNAAPDKVQTVQFSRTGQKDGVTGAVSWNAWDDGQQFGAVVSPVVNGYTADRENVSAVSVNHDSKDINVIVTYTPDVQKLDVTFIDDTAGTTLKTVVKNGVTHADAKYNTKLDIQNFESQHYVLISDSSKGAALVFDNDDAVDQHYVVHLKHNTHAISEHHTVNETVHYKMADGTIAPVNHTAKIEFSRDGFNDEVTGDDHWNVWTPSAIQQFDAVQSPVVKGYTPDVDQITAVTVNPDSQNIDRTVTYLPNVQIAHVKYIDDTDHKVLTQDDLTGRTGETSGYHTTDRITEFKGQHYVLVSDNYPTNGMTFDSNDRIDQNYEVHFKHGTRTDEQDVQVPRTIKYVYQNGQSAQPDHTDALSFHEIKVADLVDGHTVSDDWTPAQDFKTIETPAIQGYTPDHVSVSNAGIVHDHPAIIETVTYNPDAQKAVFKYIDDTTGEQLQAKDLTGVSDQSTGYNTKETINGYVARHYDLVSDGTNGETITFDHDDGADQSYEVHFKHATDTVTETVKFQYADVSQAQPTKTQTFNFGRDGIKDLVTGTIAWMPVDSQTIAAVAVSKIDGYTADIDQVPAVKVNFGDKNITKVVTYTANDQTAGIKIIDDTTGKVLNTQSATGKFGTEIQFQQNPDQQAINLQAQHYELVSDNFKQQTYQADNAKNQFEIHVKHQMMDVQRTDTVTETIHYLGPDGNKLVSDKTQMITFTRHGVKDQVTGQIDWNSVEPQEFNAVKSPVINGYQADVAVVEGRQVLFGDQDVVVNVHYTKLPEQQLGKQPGTDMVNTGKVTPEKVVTVATGTVQETKQNPVKNPVHSTMQGTKQLPQTGNNKQAGLLSLVGSSLMASLAIFGLSRKKKHEN